MGLIEKLKEKLQGKLPEDVDLDDLVKDLDDTPPALQPTPQPKASEGDALAEMRAQFRQLQEQLAALQQALAEEQKARKEAVRALEEQRRKEQEKRIAELLDEAVKAGKIPPGKRDEWKARLEANFDLTSQIIAELPANPAVNKDEKQDAKKAAAPEPDVLDRRALVEAAKSYFNAKAATN